MASREQEARVDSEAASAAQQFFPGEDVVLEDEMEEKDAEDWDTEWVDPGMDMGEWDEEVHHACANHVRLQLPLEAPSTCLTYQALECVSVCVQK